MLRWHPEARWFHLLLLSECVFSTSLWRRILTHTNSQLWFFSQGSNIILVWKKKDQRAVTKRIPKIKFGVLIFNRLPFRTCVSYRELGRYDLVMPQSVPLEYRYSSFLSWISNWIFAHYFAFNVPGGYREASVLLSLHDRWWMFIKWLVHGPTIDNKTPIPWISPNAPRVHKTWWYNRVPKVP